MEAKLVVFGVILISLLPIVYLWVRGIDYMNKTHPDYTGDDLFGLDDTGDKNGK